MSKPSNYKGAIVKMFSKQSDMPVTLQRYSLHGQTMGTQYSAVFFADAHVDEVRINAALFAAVDVVDRQMSNWKTDSDLSRLNRAPENEWLPVPTALFDVIKCALQVGQQSHGVFDIGVGDVVRAWGFGPSLGQTDDAQVQALKAQTHQSAADVLELHPDQCQVRKRARITLDLSGIAKGYGVDQLARCLDGFGVSRYLVGIDGEMRARGTKPDGQPWAIAIEKPVRNLREVMGVMALSDAAIATSGDYRSWVDYQGKSYSHSISGALRQPVSNQLAAVTVLAANCMLADAWATALLVLGEEAGVALAQERGMDALFVLHDGDDFQQISITTGKIEA